MTDPSFNGSRDCELLNVPPTAPEYAFSTAAYEACFNRSPRLNNSYHCHWNCTVVNGLCADVERAPDSGEPPLSGW